MIADPEYATFAEMMALEPHGPDTFVGIGPRYPWGGLYGGQIVAQALRAAGLTVAPGMLPHSLHAYFIRRGDDTQPIRFEVDRIRNGRSFTTRRVVARQPVGAIFNLAASFQVAEDEVEVQAVELDPGAGSPDEHLSDGWSHVFDRRPVGDWRGAHAGGRSQAWMRMREPVGDDPLVQACAFAYLSDDLPTDGAVSLHPDRSRLQTEGDFERTFMNASLDHALWFHRPADPSAWHLHELRGHNLTGARGLTLGEIMTADGRHVATIAQEVLVRRVRS